MFPARLAAAAALLGGLLWIAHALLGGGDDAVPATLNYAGLALVVVAAAAFGSTLVKSGAVVISVVVGLASGLLALALIEAFRVDNAWYDGFWGIVAAVLGAVALVRGRGRARTRSPRPARSGGAHSR